MEARGVGSDGGDAPALLERFHQRVLHQDRQVIGPFRTGVEIDRTVGLDQRNARAVEMLRVRRRGDAEREIDLGPRRRGAAGRHER